MNTKQKGNNFEREMSRMLSLWWTNGKRDDAIWRSASSGALTTVGKGRYLAHTGDFAATDAEAAPLFDRVIIEAKRGYSRYSVQDLLDVPDKAMPKNPVWDMFFKLGRACLGQHKLGLLLWKRDRRDLLVFARNSGYFPGGIFPHPGQIAPLRLAGEGVVGVVYGMPWKYFALNVSADRIRSLPVPLAVSSASKLSIPF